MGMIKQGHVTLIIHSPSTVKVDVFGSVKELMQHYISQTSLEGVWGSSMQRNALLETKLLLDRILAQVEAELAEEQGDEP